ncbi:MAG: RdgB/HAM1 family non-canonical purine NTP pyrophosphatase [Gammaproteobacteria bacterium]
MTESRRLVVATGNAGKMREIGEILREPNIELVRDAPLDMDSVEETGSTFVENALLKARYAARVSGVAALADDSGIEVDALNGAPGIYSARYAGPGASDTDNVAKLLAALQGVAGERRSARFRCVMVVLRHAADPSPLICEGTWEGMVATTARGAHGFGYDPVFVPQGMTEHSAELDRDVKNRISHRGQALNGLRERLAAFLVR